MTDITLAVALEYASIGWRVFPCEPRGKKPLIKDWPNAATTRPEAIEAWFSEWPDANIGIATGRGSGFFVIDVDGEQGSRSLNNLESEIGPLPETLEAMTGGGGRHLLQQYPKDREVRNKQSFRPGLDIRGEGGYIIAAPSIHPETGNRYEWPYGMEEEVAKCPDKWLDIIAPMDKQVQEEDASASIPVEAIMEKKEPERSVISKEESSLVMERASKYLEECDLAAQGSGGHNDLLWAARAMVVGFELSDSDALSILKSEFNPLCSPPWDLDNPAELKDFERKVTEARNTPGKKPAGWLLDECGLRSGDEKLAAIGKVIGDNLVATANANGGKYSKVIVVNRSLILPDARQYVPFPVELFPPELMSYVMRVAEAHGVDPAFVALPVIGVGGSAMGNSWRLLLKGGFMVPPTTWVGLIAESGVNKTGPLQAVISSLRKTPDFSKLETPMLNPQGRMLLSDATLEAVVARLGGNPRGQLVFRDELAGWIKSFNAYRSGGGDEQAWLEFWNANEYQLDRKTDNEEMTIPAASVGVLGGVQPEVLAECFDPGRFASGLVPRLLIASPPDTGMFWTDTEITPEIQKIWDDLVMWLRTRPFASLNPDTGRYMPNIIEMDPMAKSRYVDFFNEISREMLSMGSLPRKFASKARLFAARNALIHHGFALGLRKGKMDERLSLTSAEAGAGWARWFLNEQLRVYGAASGAHDIKVIEDNVAIIKTKLNGRASGRMLMRVNSRKYNNANEANAALDQIVAANLGRWDDRKKVMTLI